METNPERSATTMERTSDRDLVVTRTFNAPARLVFAAWTRADLFKQWWVPKSFPVTLLSCELDVRTGGRYRLVFAHGDSKMEFFGRYIDVVPNARIVWTNEEGGENAPVTTVTFDEKGGQTVVVMRDTHPSKEALDEAIASGSSSGNTETFEQLATLLESMPA